MWLRRKRGKEKEKGAGRWRGEWGGAVHPPVLRRGAAFRLASQGGPLLRGVDW